MASREMEWCLGRDFNTMRNKKGKIGKGRIGRTKTSFGDFIENNGLLDLEMAGNSYTWCRYKDGKVYSRLDRFLLRVEWMQYEYGLFKVIFQALCLTTTQLC
ncbi:Uncharacterized protein TCM_024236 [Theobroma cacao]|uniref:Uncharacterized protein n=1 Tax=Theobroma cacao TaxID=3641 RepID=A0A061EWY5_THECC|nr:Uncharacterized protein TCM_024236 [Theobroma cacao]